MYEQKIVFKVSSVWLTVVDEVGEGGLFGQSVQLVSLLASLEELLEVPLLVLLSADAGGSIATVAPVSSQARVPDSGGHQLTFHNNDGHGDNAGQDHQDGGLVHGAGWRVLEANPRLVEYLRDERRLLMCWSTRPYISSFWSCYDECDCADYVIVCNGKCRLPEVTDVNFG